MVTQMLAVGEETGNLDGMLQKVADFYDDEVAATVKSLTSILEPIMMLAVGAIVGTRRHRDVPAALQDLRPGQVGRSCGTSAGGISTHVLRPADVVRRR